MTRHKEINKDIALQRFSQASENSEYEFEKFFLARFFDLNFSYSNETCTVEFQVEDFMYNPRCVLHGGVIAFVMDVSMGHLCKKFIGTSATIEMKVQYLTPVTSGSVSCEARFLKKGRKIVYVESRMTDQDGELVAMATATFKTVAD